MLEQAVSTALSLPPVLYVVVILASVWYFKIRNRLPENVPPFPTRPFPILGHIPMMNGANVHKTLKEWQKKTDGFYSIYMGHTLAVVIGNYKILKEAFVKHGDRFSDRAHRFVDTDDRFMGGILDTSGALWKEQRSVAITILRKFGMGKNWMGEKISIEVHVYLDALAKTKGEPIDIHWLTNGCISNVICTVLTGHRFELNDPQCQRLFEVLSEQVRYLQGGSALKVFPWLKYLPGDMFHAKAMLKNEEIFRSEFSMKYIKKIKEHSDEQNFIKSYLDAEKEKKKSGEETTLSEQNLIMIITNLFQAGTETSATTIRWALLYAIYHPEIQKKVQQEIDDVIGKDSPNAEDKNKLKYVNAFIMETQRLASVVPLILPHMCSKTTTIAGRTIPEGTLVMPYLDGILHDPVWGDPMVFRPERFINDEGDLVMPENFIPFGIGGRLCMADILAKMELFMFLTGILQKFNVRPEDPKNLPSLEQVYGLVCGPKPYKLRFIPRQ